MKLYLLYILLIQPNFNVFETRFFSKRSAEVSAQLPTITEDNIDSEKDVLATTKITILQPGLLATQPSVSNPGPDPNLTKVKTTQTQEDLYKVEGIHVKKLFGRFINLKITENEIYTEQVNEVVILPNKFYSCYEEYYPIKCFHKRLSIIIKAYISNGGVISAGWINGTKCLHYRRLNFLMSNKNINLITFINYFFN